LTASETDLSIFALLIFTSCSVASHWFETANNDAIWRLVSLTRSSAIAEITRVCAVITPFKVIQDHRFWY